MTPQEEFILFLQEHPELHLISRTDLYMEILSYLSKEAMPVETLYSLFKKVDRKDMDLILNSLIKLRLVKKSATGGTVIYFLTKEGKKFVEKFTKMKKSFEL